MVRAQRRRRLSPALSGVCVCALWRDAPAFRLRERHQVCGQVPGEEELEDRDLGQDEAGG